MATSVAPPAKPQDDLATIVAISLIAAMIADVSHEAVGHGALDLLTGAQSGMLTSVAWSSARDSRLVAAGGTLVNLTLGIVSWLALRGAKNASPRLRYFLFTSMAFNLFAGTGYFLFSGVTNFGDWAVVIAGLHAHWLWRTLLVAGGIALYYASVLLVGGALVRDVGVPLYDSQRWWRLTLLPYFSAVLLLASGGILNPIGIQFVWESALPASAGANSGLLWMKYYISKRIVPEREPDVIGRSYAWMTAAAALSLTFIFVIGRGITLHRFW